MVALLELRIWLEIISHTLVKVCVSLKIISKSITLLLRYYGIMNKVRFQLLEKKIYV